MLHMIVPHVSAVSTANATVPHLLNKVGFSPVITLNLTNFAWTLPRTIRTADGSEVGFNFSIKSLGQFKFNCVTFYWSLKLHNHSLKNSLQICSKSTNLWNITIYSLYYVILKMLPLSNLSSFLLQFELSLLMFQGS